MNMSNTTISKCLRPDIQIKLLPEEQQLFDILLEANASSQCNSILRVAGGWVRDKILGKDSHDIDIAIDNMSGYDFAVKISPFLLEHGGDPSHLGRIKANPDKSKHLETTRLMVYNTWIDLVNLRSETYTETSRIPSISIGTPSEDAYRRDLTINSMFYNLNIHTVEDFTEKGVDDLLTCTIRTPLPPLITFLDDPLRILRCIRFTSRFNFHIDSSIIQEGKDPRIREALCTKVSDERKGLEIYTAFKYSSQSAYLCMKYLYEFKLFSVLLPCYTSIVKPLNKRISDVEADLFHDKKCLYRFYSTEELVPLFKDIDITLPIGSKDSVYNDNALYDQYYKEGVNKLKYIQDLSSSLTVIHNVLQPYASYQTIFEDSETYISYASFFSVFSYLFIPIKDTYFPLTTFYLRDLLKFKVTHSGNITVLCHLSTVLARYIFTQEDKKTPYFNVVEIGSYILTLKELWPLALEFTLYDYIYSNRNNIDIQQTCDQFISFIHKLEDHSFTNIWKMPVPVDGCEIVNIGFKRGPTLRYPVQFVKNWQLQNPYGNPDICKEELKTFLKNNPQYGK